MIEAIVYKAGLAVIDYSDGDLDCDFCARLEFQLQLTNNVIVFILIIEWFYKCFLPWFYCFINFNIVNVYWF